MACWPTDCDQDAVGELMNLDFCKTANSVVLTGPNGVGKTTIACNILHQAVLQGYTALFVNAAKMLNELAAQESDAALQRRLNHYSRPHLLCIDGRLPELRHTSCRSVV